MPKQLLFDETHNKIIKALESNSFVCVDEKDFYLEGKRISVAFYECEVNDNKYGDTWD